MIPLIVVENTAGWPLHLPGAEVLSARRYLTDPRYSDLRHAAVFNLCRNYGYQRTGYYVSLLAAARGHRPMPSVDTIQALRLSPLVRIVAEDLEELIRQSLAPLKSSTFDLSIYFGRNVAKRYDRLSRALFNQFPAPFLRAQFVKDDADGSWMLKGVGVIAAKEIPDAHRDFVIERAREYFARPRRARAAPTFRYDLAILWTPGREDVASDEGAIRKFVRAARKQDMDATVIGADDYGQIGEFDALFIRDTTYVNQYTYRFARRATSSGLVVIDDPESIIRCTNKVYQAELFARHQIPAPKTALVHTGNVDEAVATIGFPCILKRPDSSFSAGVVKVENRNQLAASLTEFLAGSELVVAQEYVPSAFDWRVGVLNHRALYVAKYYMARGHWQIIARGAKGPREGKWETISVDAAPREVVELGVRSASLIGDGLYGVDIKEIDGRLLVMEINDNPSIEAGCEDQVLKDELYRSIMGEFRRRLDAQGS